MSSRTMNKITEMADYGEILNEEANNKVATRRSYLWSAQVAHIRLIKFKIVKPIYVPFSEVGNRDGSVGGSLRVQW